MALLRRIVATERTGATLLIRLVVGGVFLSEGVQKFLYPASLGVGRFVKIGIPLPEFSAPFVGACEIVCGALILAGLLTRAASAVMVVNILVAIVTTKIPLLVAGGVWAFAHEARVDYAMLLGGIFLVIRGAGGISCDVQLQHSRLIGKANNEDMHAGPDPLPPSRAGAGAENRRSPL